MAIQLAQIGFVSICSTRRQVTMKWIDTSNTSVVTSAKVRLLDVIKSSHRVNSNTWSAEDKGTGNREKIVITNDQNRLTPDNIERMIKDAEKFADDDKKLKERVESRNELESYAYSLKNQISDKDKLGAKVLLVSVIQSFFLSTPHLHKNLLEFTYLN